MSNLLSSDLFIALTGMAFDMALVVAVLAMAIWRNNRQQHTLLIRVIKDGLWPDRIPTHSN